MTGPISTTSKSPAHCRLRIRALVPARDCRRDMNSLVALSFGTFSKVSVTRSPSGTGGSARVGDGPAPKGDVGFSVVMTGPGRPAVEAGAAVLPSPLVGFGAVAAISGRVGWTLGLAASTPFTRSLTRS